MKRRGWKGQKSVVRHVLRLLVTRYFMYHDGRASSTVLHKQDIVTTTFHWELDHYAPQTRTSDLINTKRRQIPKDVSSALWLLKKRKHIRKVGKGHDAKWRATDEGVVYFHRTQVNVMQLIEWGIPFDLETYWADKKKGARPPWQSGYRLSGDSTRRLGRGQQGYRGDMGKLRQGAESSEPG